MHRNKSGALVNGEGLSWSDWHHAAGINLKDETLKALAEVAWSNGEDPTEWRVTHIKTIAERIETMRIDMDHEVRRLLALMSDRGDEGRASLGLVNGGDLHRIDKELDSIMEQLSILRDRVHGRSPLDKGSSTKKMRKFLGYAYP